MHKSLVQRQKPLKVASRACRSAAANPTLYCQHICKFPVLLPLPLSLSVSAGRRLPLPLALKYSVDIAKGLVELHRLGVTAADLKPDNVLIDDELGDAVIADFGISTVVTCSIGVSAAAAAQKGGRRGNSAGGGATRSSGVLRGTPNYM